MANDDRSGGFGNGAAEDLQNVPDDIVKAGWDLYQRALRRSRVKRISVPEAFRELANELPPSLRTAALEAINRHGGSKKPSGDPC